MKQSRFTETQIVNILREVDAGMKVEDICRKHGMSSATYYKWKSKYGGMDASELRQVKRVLPKRMAHPLHVEARANHQWVLDFMHDGLSCGKRFRTLNIVDEGTREFLDAYLFESLEQVQEMAWFWRLDYNEERTHESIGHLPPAAYRKQLENSTLELSH
ncbi:transposase [Celerinatantimonas sp. YJH-8]|uniref:transposase n=1 Tax=Celerinatantimonas sp. YJH-8 TaxID=3228714 RepID=UPI0038BE7EF0